MLSFVRSFCVYFTNYRVFFYKNCIFKCICCNRKQRNHNSFLKIHPYTVYFIHVVWRDFLCHHSRESAFLEIKMEKKKSLAAAAMLAASLAAFSHAAPDPNFHIYLAFGQSNMEGQGIIENQDKTVNEKFQVMWSGDNGYCANRTKGSWYSATPPLASCDGKLGPVDYFGRTMLDSLPAGTRIGVIVVAVAGCDIQLFEKTGYQSYAATAQSWMTSRINNYGGNPYGRLIDMAKNAQQDGVIKGILLHQGETNSGQSNWPGRVKGIYNNIIADLGLDASKTPLVAGEVHPNGSCKGMNSIIANLPKENSNFYVASAQGITGMLQDGQSVHFDAAGYRELGKRYAATMMKALRAIGPIEAATESSSSQTVFSSSSEMAASSGSVAPTSSSSDSLNSSDSGTALAELRLQHGTAENQMKVYSIFGNEVLSLGRNSSYGDAIKACNQKLPAGKYILDVRGNGMSRHIIITVK